MYNEVTFSSADSNQCHHSVTIVCCIVLLQEFKKRNGGI